MEDHGRPWKAMEGHGSFSHLVPREARLQAVLPEHVASQQRQPSCLRFGQSDELLKAVQAVVEQRPPANNGIRRGGRRRAAERCGSCRAPIDAEQR